MDIRDSLREFIEENGYKQITVAKKAEMSPSTLCAVIKKRRALEANELFRLCDALGVKPEVLRSYGSNEKTA
ncbi:helix-turn-helix domain-containing protein [Ruthenibacterium lactatiformans]|uniref:helix-turn-helix domain-containing protein n=1 Tax=Ruthenibacterium lactatiformans TaxID=1550024 RepID=UPI002675B165|nr:helix-turn-helix transcriptional regulator [Ruthenibacterium lactatiformans]